MEEIYQKIIDFVKEKPKTIQEVSQHIGKSWVTTEKYVQEIKKTSGKIDVRTFREGTRGALKIVYSVMKESLISDAIKEDLFNKILMGKEKQDFDALDIFQFVKDDKKKASITTIDGAHKPYLSFLSQTTNNLLLYSGNLSLLSEPNTGKEVIKLFENLLKQKVSIKIICKISLATMKNIKLIENLIIKYSELIEIHHCHQPLRGAIIDNKIARLYCEENTQLYKKGELEKNSVITYDIFDSNWVSWLEQLFWYQFRNTLDYKNRLNELKKIKLS
ncbi:MAG: hypothetical protein AB7V77_00705 [Candidatus Woesearchaeota archaeon]